MIVQFRAKSYSMNCSIKDVARKAGVSVGTVSRVINGCENVAVERVTAVRTAIAELGYRKNSAAQLLAGRRGASRLRTGNLGLWMAEMGDDWSTNPVYTNYLGGIEAVCAQRGYHVLIEHGGHGGCLRCVREGKVDGLIVKAVNNIPDGLEELARQLPVIGLSMLERRLPIAQVTTDNQLAGEEVCRYLWERGHRRIGFVHFCSYHQMFFARRAGYEYFLSRQNAYDPNLIFAVPDLRGAHPAEQFPDMRPALDALLTQLHPPTAIIAANDWMAAGLYEALATRQLQVPQDISIVGFDHLEQLYLRPRLTSFEIPMREMGKAAAEWLLDILDQQAERPSTDPIFRMVSGRIVEHESVARCSQESNALLT